MVVSRNSTFVYKGKPVDIKQVSKEQGVRYVLEGSVRKAGDRIRINAQLIDATSGHHVWAERYDRQLEDIFAVQDEITREVTLALDVRLSWGEQAISWSRGTSILEAWELVRQAMDAINTNTLGASRKARELCARALELDPEYAMAWVMQGHCHHQLADESNRHGYMDAQERELSLAMECGHKALALDPTLADAYALLSICHLTDFDFERALETSREALNLAPVSYTHLRAHET